MTFATTKNSATLIPVNEAMPELFKCYGCGDMLPAGAFFPDSSKASRPVSPICKLCNTEYQRRRNYKKVIETEGIEGLDEKIRKKQKELQSMLEVRAEFGEGN